MIRLFTTVYNERDLQRIAEYHNCLENNISNSVIEEICIFSEGGEKLLPESPKLKIREINCRPTYSDYFQWIASVSEENDISIIANTDIYFDASIAMLKRFLRSNVCVALARWDIQPDGKAVMRDRNDSQDSWIFRGKVRAVEGGFPIGVPRCDNRILFELLRAEYRVLNPAISLRSFHLHRGDRNDYGTENLPNYVSPPYAYLWPHNLMSLPMAMIHNLLHPHESIRWAFDRRRFMRSLPCRIGRKLVQVFTPNKGKSLGQKSR